MCMLSSEVVVSSFSVGRIVWYLNSTDNKDQCDLALQDKS